MSFPDDSFGKESRFGIPFTVSVSDQLKFGVCVFLNYLEVLSKAITNSSLC